MAERGSVLVVEDEGLVRMVLADELAETGFSVVEAASADAAIELLAGGLAPSAVVTDVRMPGRRDGLGLAAWLREHYPRVPVIVTSGFVKPADAIAVNPATVAVLAKPYDCAAVAALLAQAGVPSGKL
jgi:CheY-like chemotaxis protein